MKVANLAALVAVILGIFFVQSEALRLHKEYTRPKCLRNFTSQSPKCITLYNRKCLNLQLPYNSTLIPDYIPFPYLGSSDDVYNYLESWLGAEKLPKCWPILQVALCSILMPQCDVDSDTGLAARAHLSSVDICNDLRTKPECSFISHQLDQFPIFKCNDTNLFAKNCTNGLRNLKYTNTQTQKPSCHYPHVASEDEVSGCAIHCKYPVTDRDDQDYISIWIKLWSLVGMLCTFTIGYMLYFNNVINSELDKAIQHFNASHLVQYGGWLLQVMKDFSCTNGIASYGQPSILCVLSSFLTYVPWLSSLAWHAYVGKLTSELIANSDQKNKSQNRDRCDGFTTLKIYGMPLVFFAIIWKSGFIDSHGLYGICTVGQQSIRAKALFVHLPLILITIYGIYHDIRIIKSLLYAKESRLRCTLVRIAAQTMLMSTQTIFIIGNYFYFAVNNSGWRESIDRYISCSLNLPSESTPSECRIDNEPNSLVYYSETFSILALPIVVSWLYKSEARQEELGSETREMDQPMLGRNENSDTNFQHYHGPNIRLASDTPMSRWSSLKSTNIDLDLSQQQYKLLNRRGETPMSRRPSLRSTALELEPPTKSFAKGSEKKSRQVIDEIRNMQQTTNEVSPLQRQVVDIVSNPELMSKMDEYYKTFMKPSELQFVPKFAQGFGTEEKKPTAAATTPFIESVKSGQVSGSHQPNFVADAGTGGTKKDVNSMTQGNASSTNIDPMLQPNLMLQTLQSIIKTTIPTPFILEQADNHASATKVMDQINTSGGNTQEQESVNPDLTTLISDPLLQALMFQSLFQSMTQNAAPRSNGFQPPSDDSSNQESGSVETNRSDMQAKVNHLDRES